MTTVDGQSPLTHAAVTNVGMRRANNQDSHAVVLAPDARQWRERGHLFLVADGMGAHAAGEMASQMAADGVVHTYLQRRDALPPEALRQAVSEVNSQIHERGESSIEFKGMGTTCSTLLLLPQGALAAHVGDSRVYRLRRNTLEQLSFDHSLVWELKTARDLTAAESAHFPKNIITRSLGPNAQVEVDLEGPFPVEKDDVYLLCSDGLTGEVTDDELGIILQTLPPAEAAQMLVDLANLRGGPDNITVIVIRIESDELTTSAATGVAPPHEAVPGGGLLRSLMWVLAAAGGAVALAGALLPQMQLAIGGGVALVVCTMFALLLKPTPAAAPPPASSGGTTWRRYGRGPHTSTTCHPNGRFANALAELAKQLREAVQDQGDAVNVRPYDDHERDAAAAAQHKDWPAATRAHCHAILHLMHELRRDAPKSA